ncbi:hypothetical protein [Sphingomonas sp.]|uniref:hypothetical protein n=1 Tax=Sphingomonas sp. TaxID=28214 RepID=UPI0025D8A919|nr:hypothetical protein [Sphingomonas sp.]MBV9527879.1 hypothetical protein [Sphingomonas sp.]
MDDDDPWPSIGEVVSALSRFAPETLHAVKRHNPDLEVLWRRGTVLGDSPAGLSCDLTLEMLSRYGEAALKIQKRIRRRLRIGWYYDLVAKLIAAAGAGGASAAFLSKAVGRGLAPAVLAFVASSSGVVLSFLHRTESGGSLLSDYNRLVHALVEADQARMTITRLRDNGPKATLKRTLEKANRLCATLNDFAIRYG